MVTTTFETQGATEGGKNATPNLPMWQQDRFATPAEGQGIPARQFCEDNNLKGGFFTSAQSGDNVTTYFMTQLKLWA